MAALVPQMADHLPPDLYGILNHFVDSLKKAEAIENVRLAALSLLSRHRRPQTAD